MLFLGDLEKLNIYLLVDLFKGLVEEKFKPEAAWRLLRLALLILCGAKAGSILLKVWVSISKVREFRVLTTELSDSFL